MQKTTKNLLKKNLKSQTYLSVIMPVYNTKQWVWEAIESILNQTFEDFEFIIVDDYSTDGSYEICKGYAKKDKRIKLYRNNKNEWLCYTRNRLISLTNTDYIASQDSDDVSKKNRLELEYKFLSDNSKYSVIGWDCEIIDENGEKIWLRRYSDNISNTILKKSPIANPTSMYRKSHFYEVWWYTNNRKLDGTEDYDLWLNFYLHWYLIKNLKKILLEYRIREWQTKSNIKKILKSTIYIQKKYIKLGIKSNISDKLYILCEHILLLFPNRFINYLFKKITYKNF